MTDEGLREIQLDGKQLVFLFMAATVVAVVIFLCGVMVGRGVSAAGATIAVGEQIGLDPTAASLRAPSRATDGNGPVAADEVLSYNDLLGNGTSPEETLTPASETVAEPSAPQPAVEVRRPVVAPKPAPKPSAVASPKPAPVAPRPALASRSATPAPRPATPAPAETATNLTEPQGNGFVVQVAAVRQKTEANNIARRLSAKGYPAFVTSSGANFRVRIGKYGDRREAETVASRLQKEERFKPWITR